MAEQLTIDLIVGDEAAKAKMVGFCQTVGTNVRVVSKEFDGWDKGVSQASATLQRLVVGGGALWTAARLASQMKEAFESAGNKLSGNWDTSRQYAQARELAVMSILPTMTPGSLDAMVGRIGGKYGGTAKQIVSTIGAITGAARNITPDTLETVAGKIQEIAVRAGQGDQFTVPMGQAYSALTNAFPEVKPDQAMALLQLWRREWYGEDPTEFARNMGPLATRLKLFTTGDERERLAQIMAITSLYSAQMADPTGATTGTASFLGLMGMWGKTFSGEKLPADMPLDERLIAWGKSVQDFETANGAEATMKRIRKTFEGRALTEGTTAGLLKLAATDRGQAIVREQFRRAREITGMSDAEFSDWMLGQWQQRLGGAAGPSAGLVEQEARLQWQRDVAARGTPSTQAQGMYESQLSQFIAMTPSLAPRAGTLARDAMGLQYRKLAAQGVPGQDAARQAFFAISMGLADYLGGRGGAEQAAVFDVWYGGAGAKGRLSPQDRATYEKAAAGMAMTVAQTPEEQLAANALAARANMGVEGRTGPMKESEIHSGRMIPTTPQEDAVIFAAQKYREQELKYQAYRDASPRFDDLRTALREKESEFRLSKAAAAMEQAAINLNGATRNNDVGVRSSGGL